jgi:MYXO-CTERM domain-containing protein
MSTQPAQPNAAGCQLSYGGGPMLQNVKVFDVFYNQGNTYRDMLSAYYTAITASAHFDWLSEYNAGSYKIGRGTFLGYYEDTNSATTKKTIDDSAMGAYLDGLISAGKIPAPDDNTIYQIYFPAAVTITLQGKLSCNYFCAYHSGWDHGNQHARYSVIPDVTMAPCKGGCGSSTTQFNNLTSVSSHELIEAVTDPDGNSAWVDTTSGCGEIGDICNAQQGTVAGYTVQKEWSNKNNACIVTDPNVTVNDFSVAASPTMVTVPQGGMATVQVTLTKVAGMAENAALTATTPAGKGLVASLSPTSATSDNGKSTLTITASPTATVGMAGNVTVKAAGTSVAPTATVAVTVTAPPDMAMAPDLATPSGGGGSGGTGGGGSGGGGGDGTGTGGNGGSGGSGGGNGNHGGGSDSGCSIGGGSIAGSWGFAALLLVALAFRRRRA